MTVTVRVPREWRAWSDGFRDLPRQVAAATVPHWLEAMDVQADRTTAVMHVLTGTNRAMLRDPDVVVEGTAVVGQLVDESPHAIYEHRRGGSHAFMTRGFLAARTEFPDAMRRGWADTVRSWS